MYQDKIKKQEELLKSLMSDYQNLQQQSQNLTQEILRVDGGLQTLKSLQIEQDKPLAKTE